MTFAVQVSRKDLASALRTLARFVKRKQEADAVVSFADGTLQIELPGGAVGVAAQGEWDGEVRVPGRFLLTYAKSLPAADPMPVEVRGDRFRLAGLSVGCVLQEATGDRIELPLDPSVVDILRMLARYSDEEIERSGLTALVSRVAMQFAEIGVPRAEFDRFIDECLRRREGP